MRPQLVSYEVSLSLSVIGVILLAKSLNLSAIVDKQIDTVWFVVRSSSALLCSSSPPRRGDGPGAVQPRRG